MTRDEEPRPTNGNQTATATKFDLPAEQRKVRRAGLASLLFCAAVLGVGYVVLPRLFHFPAGLGDRLAFALQADLFILVWIMIAVRMVSSGRLRSPPDIGGSALAPPSPAIAVKVAFLKNTLEQAVLAVGVHLALATLMGGSALSLIVGGVVLFGIVRLAFYRGYPKGAGGRAFGMVTTTLPTLAGLLLANWLVIAQFVGL